MDYIVYTDGSCRIDLRKASYSYIIRTKKTCVNVKYCSYAGECILDAEITAVREAISYLLESNRLVKGDSVKFFIDSLYALKAYDSVLKGKELPNKVKPELMETASILVKRVANMGIKLIFTKIDAHQTKFNTNKACDSLAKIALSYNL